jgi:type IV pilus assembly protein PilV
MIARSTQKGVGMMEVLVALIVLAVGVLGYVMLQVRAMEATTEGTQRIQAINIARDLAERVRVNREAWLGTNTYLAEFSGTQARASTTPDCAAANCNAAQLADFDVAELSAYAVQYGMTLGMSACPSTNGRQCLFVAWGDTVAANSTNTNSCVNGNAYRTSSTCVMMEVY